ncbi:MAG: hypothetical protein HYU69_17050 [Bacteroidetes bacterium]|nr:hypothetical protein [Bacteroidota bacterium]
MMRIRNKNIAQFKDARMYVINDANPFEIINNLFIKSDSACSPVRIKFIYVPVCIFMVFLFSCKKESQRPANPAPPSQGIDLSVSYKVDSDVFMTNHFMYKTQAGYDYSITRLVYYLSEISLIKADSSGYLLKDYQYMDALTFQTNQLTLTNIPAGNYIGLKFNIGLDSIHNISDTLAVTPENINMQWPQMMGGGYHFLKLEGYYKDSSGTYGYNMHLGTNNCLIHVKLYKPITISTDTKTPVSIVMNINEWFRDPHVFDFNVDGNYIMGNAVAMKKIAENGTDVFSF